jgi:N-acetylmuramoyl-L-alanine amidase
MILPDNEPSLKIEKCRKEAEDRGGYLLRYTKAPCLIAEPFFIDNNNDLTRAQEDLDGLTSAYASAIDEVSQIA